MRIINNKIFNNVGLRHYSSKKLCLSELFFCRLKEMRKSRVHRRAIKNQINTNYGKNLF